MKADKLAFCSNKDNSEVFVPDGMIARDQRESRERRERRDEGD